jgi:hypothetical protein
MVLGYLALAHLVFYPALQSHVFLDGRDTTGHDYGMLYYYWHQYLYGGRLSLWNPCLFTGIPSLATFAAYPFYPVTWLFAVLPFPAAFNYQYIVNDFLAGLWTWWAARQMRIGRAGAFFAGLLFMVSGHLVTLAHAGHLQKVAAIAWLPFVIGCVTAAMRKKLGTGKGGWGWWAAAGVGIGLQLLASHVQIAYYTVLCAFFWMLWLAIVGRLGNPSEVEQVGNLSSPHPDDSTPIAVCQSEPLTSRRPRPLFFGIAGFLIALAVAGALSAAQILPSIELTPYTNRGGGIPLSVAAETSYPPFEFIEYLLPSFLGDNTLRGIAAGTPYWGRWGEERIVTDYMGILPIILLVFALATRRFRDGWFWLAVILATALLAAGKYSAVYRLAFEWLPGLNHFRSPGTIMVLITWPAAVLAGMGLESFTRQAAEPANRRRYLLVALLATVVLAVFAAIVAAPQWGFSIPAIPGRPNPRTASIFLSLERSLLFGALSCAALALLALLHGRASALPFERMPERRPERRGPTVREGAGAGILSGAALAAVMALAFIDPRLHETRYIAARDVRPFHLYLLSHWSDSIVKSLPPPVRGIELGNEFSNRMMTRGIGTLHGYHPVYLRAYADLMNLYPQVGPQPDPRFGQLVYEQFILGPARMSTGGAYRAVAEERGQALYLRQPRPLYAYFPAEVALSTSSVALLASMRAADFNPYRRSFTLDPYVALQSGGATTPTVRLLQYSPDRIDLEVSTARERTLVLADLVAPGWEAKLDFTQYLSIWKVNHAFRALRIPQGTHRITLAYQPFSFRLGLYLTLFTLAVVIAWGLKAIAARPFSRSIRNQT